MEFFAWHSSRSQCPALRKASLWCYAVTLNPLPEAPISFRRGVFLCAHRVFVVSWLLRFRGYEL